MKNKKEPLVIYWASGQTDHISMRMFFDNPEVLYKDLIAKKDPRSQNDSLFNCPAVSPRLKNTLVFKNKLKTKIEYDFSNPNKAEINNVYGLEGFKSKATNIIGGSYMRLDMSWFFFCEEPVTALINTPMMHKPTKFSNSGFFPPGQLNIGMWFRPIASEIQLWEENGTLEIDENDPLFYIEFLTDRPIEIKRFNMNRELNRVAASCMESVKLFGRTTPLSKRYQQFVSSRTNKVVLNEIKRNLV